MLWWDSIFFERTTKFVDPINRQTYDFVSEIPCLVDYTNVSQLDHENENSWYHLLIVPMLFKKTFAVEANWASTF